MAKVFILVQEEDTCTGRHDFTDVMFSLSKETLEREIVRIYDEDKSEGFIQNAWDEETKLPTCIESFKTGEIFFIKEAELM